MANKRDQAFLKLANELTDWFKYTYTNLALDELAPAIMNSREKREELATHLNEWAKDLFGRAADAVEKNFNGRPQIGGFGIPELIYFPGYSPLNPQYLKRKTDGYGVGKKGAYTHVHPARRPSSFFLLSGKLQDNLRGLAGSLPTIRPDMVRVSRVVQSETHRLNPKTGRIDRTFRVLIDELGQFTNRPVTSGWEVKVFLPPGLSVTNGVRGSLEKILFPGSENAETVNKLVNAGSGSRPYRPLLGPYVEWFLKYRTPDAIRQAYSRKP